MSLPGIEQCTTWASASHARERQVYKAGTPYTSMDNLISCDSSGRIYLAEALRRKYGDRFRLEEEDAEIRLVPVDSKAQLSADTIAAVEEFREITKPLRGKSMKELKDAIDEQAMLEAGG